MEEALYDPLLLMAFYHLDFLCIRPFPHENGKMARLILMLQLLRRSCSPANTSAWIRIIEDTDEAYFESIRLSGKRMAERRTG
jgi:Fic family protein